MTLLGLSRDDLSGFELENPQWGIMNTGLVGTGHRAEPRCRFRANRGARVGSPGNIHNNLPAESIINDSHER